MTAYFYSFGVHDVVVEYIDDWPRTEAEELCGIVVAPTRGKAKQLALVEEQRHEALEWRDLRTLHKLCTVTGGAARVVMPGDPEYGRLWNLVASPPPMKEAAS